jgi:hypothetical protein
MGTPLFNDQHTAEPGPCSLFPNWTFAGQIAVVDIVVDGGSEEFTVGDTITDDGVGAGEGILLSISGSSGVWDGTTSSGTATLRLGTVTGTFTNNAGITGALTGVAVGDGTGTAGNLSVDPTDVKGKGITSVVASTTLGQVGRYTITLRDYWAGLLAVKSCFLDEDTTDDWEVTIVSEGVATDKTVVIQLFKSGTASSSATDEKLYMELVLATSSALPRSF